MIVHPSSSYEIELPDDIKIKTDEHVTSYWMEGSHLLLQLSSFRRASGVQLEAERRLQDRIGKGSDAWKKVDAHLCQDRYVDQASAEQCKEGLMWLHSYFVWPHLTVYATVSGSEAEVNAPNSWVRHALAGLTLLVQ